MATLYKTDGTVETVTPARGNKWTLDELQQHVGGMIELMPAVAPLRMLFDEEGRVKQRPFNVAATRVLHQRMAQVLGCAVSQLPDEVGRRLRYLPQVVGDVLVLEPSEKF